MLTFRFLAFAHLPLHTHILPLLHSFPPAPAYSRLRNRVPIDIDICVTGVPVMLWVRVSSHIFCLSSALPHPRRLPFAYARASWRRASLTPKLHPFGRGLPHINVTRCAACIRICVVLRRALRRSASGCVIPCVKACVASPCAVFTVPTSYLHR